jgi:hypothetical protein
MTDITMARGSNIWLRSRSKLLKIYKHTGDASPNKNGHKLLVEFPSCQDHRHLSKIDNCANALRRIFGVQWDITTSSLVRG